MPSSDQIPSRASGAPRREAGASRASAGSRSSPQLSTLRALIVEDEMFVAWHLEEILERLQIEVCAIASNAGAAVNRAMELQPDVVLMDVNLGRGPDGVQAAQEIARLTPARFVFITAYSDLGLTHRIEAAAPGSGLLQKPATADMIEAAVLELFA